MVHSNSSQSVRGSKEIEYPLQLTPRKEDKKEEAPELPELNLPGQLDRTVKRINECFERFKSNLPKLDFFDRKQLQEAFYTVIEKIPWEDISKACQDISKACQDISKEFQAGSEKNILLDKINQIITNALSFIKSFFSNNMLIQTILQSPRLFSGLSISYGFYTLYFLVSDFVTKDNGWANLYSGLDIIENLGSSTDSFSSFLVALKEIGIVESIAVVTPLANISNALSMTAMTSKAIAIAQMKEWIASLLNNSRFSENKLAEFCLLEPLLLKRHFSIDPDLIKNKIKSTLDATNKSFEEIRKDSELVIKILTDRLTTRIKGSRQSLLVSTINAIGFNTLVFTSYSLVGNLTLLITGVIYFKYWLDERKYSKIFEGYLSPTLLESPKK